MQPWPLRSSSSSSSSMDSTTSLGEYHRTAMWNLGQYLTRRKKKFKKKKLAKGIVIMGRIIILNRDWEAGLGRIHNSQTMFKINAG